MVEMRSVAPLVVALVTSHVSAAPLREAPRSAGAPTSSQPAPATRAAAEPAPEATPALDHALDHALDLDHARALLPGFDDCGDVTCLIERAYKADPKARQLALALWT